MLMVPQPGRPAAKVGCDHDPVTERHIPDPGFAGDDGSADPALAAALTAYAADRDAVPVLRALTGARLLVPVVAVLGEVEVDQNGLAHDKTSDMATVLLTGADGRQALLAFSSLATLAFTTWFLDRGARRWTS